VSFNGDLLPFNPGHGELGEAEEDGDTCPDCDGEGVDKFGFDCRRCFGEGVIDE
jgi:DnaJ-class molecular chaperone